MIEFPPRNRLLGSSLFVRWTIGRNHGRYIGKASPVESVGKANNPAPLAKALELQFCSR